MDDSVIEGIDIIEIGTVLLASCGKNAIKIARELHPNAKIAADFKIADAAHLLSTMFIDAGANYITVIAAADISTMIKAHEIAVKNDVVVQIELYGLWDQELAKRWFETGIDHIIYHQPRDSNHVWNEKDRENIKLLQKIGFNVSVTGGLRPEILPLFKGLDIYAFLVGRNIYEAKNPGDVVNEYNSVISKNWR